MRSTRRQLLLALAALPLALALPGLARAASPKEASTWASAIDAFEAQDRATAPPGDALLFVGSSSIRKWSTLARDMAPYPVINRGFGGSHLPHVTHYAPRIVLPYRPRGIVVYAGDNDIAWGASAEQVLADWRAFRALTRAELPDVPVWFLAIKPSPLRWERWPEMKRANALVEAEIRKDERAFYVDVASPLLDAQGQPVASRFAKDGLHLSAEGYQAWTRVVREAIGAQLPAPERVGGGG